MKLYHYPKCSTCRNALKWLRSNNIEAKQLDISETPPSKSELKAMLASYNGELKKLFNTSGLQYRELKLKDRLPSMTVDEAIALLNGNGMLVKRPFLLDPKGTHLVGFKETEWQALL